MRKLVEANKETLTQQGIGKMYVYTTADRKRLVDRKLKSYVIVDKRIFVFSNNCSKKLVNLKICPSSRKSK